MGFNFPFLYSPELNRRHVQDLIAKRAIVPNPSDQGWKINEGK